MCNFDDSDGSARALTRCTTAPLQKTQCHEAFTIQSQQRHGGWQQFASVSTTQIVHHYVDSNDGQAVAESLLADRIIRFLYNTARESPSSLQRFAASRRLTSALATWEFDRPLVRPKITIAQTAQRLAIDLSDVFGDVNNWKTLRDLFERQIRYWQTRPLPTACPIVSPAEGKLLQFGHANDALLSIKEKFISVATLLGKQPWSDVFSASGGIVVRLTPDVYHYVHSPVSGHIIDAYDIEGQFHSCNPTALVSFDAPYIWNRRRAVILDTDVNGGSNVGRVAVVAVAAMMIGRIEDCYADTRYDNARPLQIGMRVRQGAPMMMFRPGSSTVITLWSRDRAMVDSRLTQLSARRNVPSRFSEWLLMPWNEVSVRVRSAVVRAGAAAFVMDAMDPMDATDATGITRVAQASSDSVIDVS
jgi:phosphatidylserine decarboxylase